MNCEEFKTRIRAVLFSHENRADIKCTQMLELACNALNELGFSEAVDIFDSDGYYGYSKGEGGTLVSPSCVECGQIHPRKGAGGFLKTSKGHKETCSHFKK